MDANIDKAELQENLSKLLDVLRWFAKNGIKLFIQPSPKGWSIVVKAPK